MSGNKTTAVWTYVFGTGSDGKVEMFQCVSRGYDLLPSLAEFSLSPPFQVAEGNEALVVFKKTYKTLVNAPRAEQIAALFAAMREAGLLKPHEFISPEPTPA